MQTGRLIVGITGASGAIYAQRFLLQSVQYYKEIYLCISEHAMQVIKTEQKITLNRQNFSTEDWLGKNYSQIQLMPEKDFFCPPARGSFRHDGMVILPCSVATAGKIAHGVGDNLLTRAAEVCLKEHRKLILVPREMPWSLITLKNFTALAEAGATILPACPAWYHCPNTLEELADSVVARILQNLNINQDLFKQWMNRYTTNKTIILAGGSGFIGKHLKKKLEEERYQVKILSRKATNHGQVYWDGKNLGDWVLELENSHALINLTGKSIACRWNQKNWKEIYDSRIQPTSILGEAVSKCKFPPKYWVNVSGVHYYVDSHLMVNELGPNGNTRLAKFCREWENTIYKLEHPSVKKIILRIGFLLGNDGGAFPLLKQITRFFMGGAIGNGKQYVSWIHIEDLIKQFIWLIEKGESGFYNGVGPNPVTNQEFMRTLRSVAHRPWAPPLPTPLIPIVLPLLGFEPTLVTESHKILPERFINNRFEYTYKNLHEALKSLS